MLHSHILALEAVPGDNMLPPIPPVKSDLAYLLLGLAIEVGNLPQTLQKQLFRALGAEDYGDEVRISCRWYLPWRKLRNYYQKKLFLEMLHRGGRRLSLETPEAGTMVLQVVRK